MVHKDQYNMLLSASRLLFVHISFCTIDVNVVDHEFLVQHNLLAVQKLPQKLLMLSSAEPDNSA